MSKIVSQTDYRRRYTNFIQNGVSVTLQIESNITDNAVSYASYKYTRKYKPMPMRGLIDA